MRKPSMKEEKMGSRNCIGDGGGGCIGDGDTRI